jgi:hypothetical protein
MFHVKHNRFPARMHPLACTEVKPRRRIDVGAELAQGELFLEIIETVTIREPRFTDMDGSWGREWKASRPRLAGPSGLGRLGDMLVRRRPLSLASRQATSKRRSS